MENINLKNVEILKKDGTGNEFLADDGTYKDAGVKDYTKLDNLPTINNTQITGNLTLDNNTMNIDSNKNISAKIWKGTKAQYDAIVTKDNTMTYVVTDEYDEVNKVSGSTVNGNILIDGVETTVFNIPTKNVLYPNYDYINLEENDTTSPLYNKYVLKVTKLNMNNLIRVTDFYPNYYYLVLTDEVRAIDEGHIYYLLFDGTAYNSFDYKFGCGLVKIIDENGVEITEFINAFPNNISPFQGFLYLYSIQKTNGTYVIKLISTTDYKNLANSPNLYSDYINGVRMSQVHMENCKNLMAYNSLAIGQYNTDDSAETSGNNKIFAIGNGTSDTSRSNCFEILENGKVNIFNDIMVKAGTLLKTVKQNIVGAINEIFDFTMPVYKTTVHLHANAGDLNCGTSIPHNLGYRPSRVEGYFHGDDINGTHNLDYIYQPSFILFSHTDNISNGMYEITQVGVSEVDIAVFVQRYSTAINQTKDYVIDVYLYK